MTANELAEIADGLSCEIPIREWIDNEPKNVMNDIATMLRQQQAEIEELRKELQQIKIWCGKTQFVHDYSSPFIELQKASEK
jgi:hypothetical protein